VRLVHSTRKVQRDVQIYGVSSPPVTVQDIVPPRRKKNEHTLDNLRGKCPMIVPIFFSQPQHIDLERCAALSHTPAAASHISLYTW